MHQTQSALVKYALWLLARQLGQTGPPDDLAIVADGPEFSQMEPLAQARKWLGDESLQPDCSAGERALGSIFSQVHGPDDQPGPAATIPLRRLGLNLDQEQPEDPRRLWSDFLREVASLRQGEGAFETFLALYAVYAWSVPAALSAAATGVSLYEQFKATAALTHCWERQGSADLLLIGGDLPGIQDVLYTITSKGVAKGLRGRSFYLQLLNEVVVRAILRQLELPSCNLLYNAGGNFKIIAPAAHAAQLAKLREEINDRLLTLHSSELFIALDWQPLDGGHVMDAQVFRQAMLDVGEQVDRQKRAWFAQHAPSRYDDLFGPSGFGSLKFCDVCHVELDPKDDKERCDQCSSFEDLARRIADVARPGSPPTLVVHSLVDKLERAEQPKRYPVNKPTWEDVLEAFGYAYRFSVPGAAVKPKGVSTTLYYVNETDLLGDVQDPDITYSFRFMANSTPHVWDSEVAAIGGALNEDEKKEVRAGDIRNTTIMAKYDATGIDRYGVLRMDVDDLGRVFGERLQAPDLLHVSALSAAVSLFFEGWLNVICQRDASNWAGEVASRVGKGKASHVTEALLPYTIYAGGDDLFIVSYWDVLPYLAECIRRDFGDYVTRGAVRSQGGVEPAHVTISAGIFAEASKFPLYKAAEFAHDALDERAKARRVTDQSGKPRRTKDGVCFLGTTVDWFEFRRTRELALNLTELIKVGQQGRTAPKALLWLFASVAYLFKEDAKRAGPVKRTGKAVYGRWMWRLAYGLSQLAQRLERSSPALSKAVLQLGGNMLDLREVQGAAQWEMIEYLDLPVRWAEFLCRGE